MITAREDYLELLYRIQDPNRQNQIIRLPKDEPIYNIDLNQRTIETPKFLSVEYDHNAETIYFAVDRFYDNVDLSTVFCVVQYENANPDKTKRGYIYAVPYFDITTLAKENKILFQWVIEGPATAYSGKVTFSIKFYKISSDKIYEYVLNTQPTTSQVLHGMNIEQNSENYIYDSSTVEEIYQRIEEVSRTSDLYWIILEDDNDTEITISSNDYPIGTINKNNMISNIIQDE